MTGYPVGAHRAHDPPGSHLAGELSLPKQALRPRPRFPRSDGYTESVWIRADLIDVPTTFRFVKALTDAATHAEEALTK